MTILRLPSLAAAFLLVAPVAWAGEISPPPLPLVGGEEVGGLMTRLLLTPLLLGYHNGITIPNDDTGIDMLVRPFSRNTVQAQLTLDGEYSRLAPALMYLRLPDVISQTAGANPDQIRVMSVQPGSIVTDFRIAPRAGAPAPGAVFQAFRNALESNDEVVDSLLLQPLNATYVSLTSMSTPPPPPIPGETPTATPGGTETTGDEASSTTLGAAGAGSGDLGGITGSIGNRGGAGGAGGSGVGPDDSTTTTTTAPANGGSTTTSAAGGSGAATTVTTSGPTAAAAGAGGASGGASGTAAGGASTTTTTTPTTTPTTAASAGAGAAGGGGASTTTTSSPVSTSPVPTTITSAPAGGGASPQTTTATTTTATTTTATTTTATTTTATTTSAAGGAGSSTSASTTTTTAPSSSTSGLFGGGNTAAAEGLIMYPHSGSPLRLREGFGNYLRDGFRGGGAGASAGAAAAAASAYEEPLTTWSNLVPLDSLLRFLPWAGVV